MAANPYGRLLRGFGNDAADAPTMPLPARGQAGVRRGFRRATRSAKVLVSNLSFTLEAGQVLGITGPSAAASPAGAAGGGGCGGRAAGGAPRRRQHLRLEPRGRRPHIGYLPQDIELFPGTVAETSPASGGCRKVVDAARLAGAHQGDPELPQGYDTPIGPAGLICRAASASGSVWRGPSTAGRR